MAWENRNQKTSFLMTLVMKPTLMQNGENLDGQQDFVFLGTYHCLTTRKGVFHQLSPHQSSRNDNSDFPGIRKYICSTRTPQASSE